MSMISDHENVYEKLSSLLNIKFKAQLKDSPIEFFKILSIKNLVNNNDNFAIIFKNEKEWLVFKDRNQFINSFIKYIEIKIAELENEFEELIKFEQINMTGIKYDENDVYNRHERIGHGIHKLNQLKEKLIKSKL